MMGLVKMARAMKAKTRSSGFPGIGSARATS
jgi:hypothetical protein